MNQSATRRKRKGWQVALVVVLSPLLIAVAVVALALYLISSVCLHILIWTVWRTRGRDILFVYSDSPIWHDYIKQNILPRLGDRAVVLNWSERKRWRLSLSRMAFYHLGGYRAFNPLGVLFRPFRRGRTFRFWGPFRDFKHGHPEALGQMEREFFALAGVQGPDAPV